MSRPRAIETPLPLVRADRDRIDQVLANLIGNAVRFTPEGGHIRVSAERDREQVRFSVADNGDGIGAADLPHVFDRFWQAKRSQATPLQALLRDRRVGFHRRSRR